MQQHVSALVCPHRMAVKNFSHDVTRLTLRNSDKPGGSAKLPTILCKLRIQPVGRSPIESTALRHTERLYGLLRTLRLFEAETVQGAVVGADVDAAVGHGEAGEVIERGDLFAARVELVA